MPLYTFNSSVDGQLDIVADTEIQIAATTVDLNGNLDVSGTALVTAFDHYGCDCIKWPI
jgi:hypothetical protein